MPYGSQVNGYYGDFGNGYVPFFAVIGAYNVLMYADNIYANSQAIIPAALDSFNSMGVVNPINTITLDYNEQTTVDLTDVFAHPDNEPITVTVEDNSDPAIVDATITGNTLTLLAGQTMGTSTITLLAVGGELSCDHSFNVVVLDPNTAEVTYTAPNSPLQQAYPNNTNPYENSYTDLGWTEVEVSEPGVVVSINVQCTWNSVDYASEGSFWVQTPTGQDYEIYSASSTGATQLNLIIDDVVGSDMAGSWIFYLVDSYGDGGHQVSNFSAIFTYVGGAPSYGTLTGTITSSDTNDPIQDATITIGSLTGTSDASGIYSIPNVSSGTYTVTCMAAGYATQTANNVVITTDETTTLDFALVIGGANNPPTNLTAELQNNNVLLNWEEPAGQNGTLQWCGEFSDNSIGTNSAVDFDVAARFTSEELAGVSGLYLNEVSFVPAYEQCEYSIRVWTGGTAGAAYNAGTMVVDQLVTNIALGEWNTVSLETPVLIDASQELWIGYRSNTQGGHPAGTDAGPNVEGFGNLINLGGSWSTLTTLNAALTYNWCISATASASRNSLAEAIPLICKDHRKINDYQQISVTKFNQTAKNRLDIQRNNRSLIGFNIYRDDQVEPIQTVESTTYSFLDTNLPAGIYNYWVTALYEGDYESIPSNVVEIEVPTSTTNNNPTPAATELVGNYPNPFNPKTKISYRMKENGHVKIEVYNLRGQKVTTLVDEFKEANEYTIEWNGTDSNDNKVSSGIYLFSMQTGKYTSTKKMVLLK
ncbi:MAG: carboxypeptidase regulatory-like domain-containing protein [Candidatus Cloacimonetes bacterium]|nr:carboxypeptidase regulatory-like domain-containing protein [Candidatus Cloacimonadota bacterium]